MYYDVAINVIMVLFLCGVIIWMNLFLDQKYFRYILGVLFGLITIFVIHEKIMVIGDQYIDFKHITMTMAGFIGGPVTAVIAALMSSLYRFNVGGFGLIGGITNIIVFACFGCILGIYLKRRQNGRNVWFWFAIGIVMACILLLVISFRHLWKSDSVEVLRLVAVPYLIITPLATTIIFNYYFWSCNYFFNLSELKRMQTERIEQLTKHLNLQEEFSMSKVNLIKSQEQMASILESMTDCFCAIDNNWQITYVNRAAEIICGKSREEMVGKNFTEVLKVNDNALLHYKEVMREKKAVTFEMISEYLGNKWTEISVYPTESGLAVYLRDITSRKNAENEIARLDRLNLVGQLAAGIGHEIRNPMTTVRGYLQLLGEKPDYADRKSTFELMISEIDRANSIITEFLSLAQVKQTELKCQNVNDILNDLYPLLEADAFTQNKQINFVQGKIPNLDLNRNEVSQLVLNLTRNGLEAMGERGLLTISSYVEGDKVVLAIEDEGSGISSENLKKLGTPFFTTKHSGTGLGLATCYKIAESHNAKIHINSSSSGTTFMIRFPIPDKAG